MKKIENFIINCMYKAIQLYVSKHRFGFNGHIEMFAIPNEKMEDYLLDFFHGNKEAVDEYLARKSPYDKFTITTID